ncbi:TPA: GNAT family N-acetyltransferase [Klebsiella aerogenes]|uniref:GNAT family N-acetyltransferase n=1 Tax=Klebsiella aerogenes TaxID=548 RepID=UPI0027848C68|nr:GNAT family N-acetyltransferase [Klebsiella aerogenes]MDY0848011.1 GNAT family N-acetyltransferase [Klebsiella aerogenes]WPS32577.1 GNAT family N-acetyltransferase [Klebsiella aerogenes]HBV6390857.1 GNAT family N-acetyltransferase [Klebsiella aerogenes]HDT0780424.1 GNAT family N-acetyltransferase [Klebsiella aerogenes]HDU4323258.1 GNAT family N-acetyltransferase [Klebsiella aerogenes]
MEFTAVPAVQFSGAQLTTILNDCFADYLVPVSMSVDLFVQRFSAEGLNLLQSKVWLAGDEPAAIGLIARRGRDARLAAFAIHPGFRGKGRGRQLMTSLIADLRAQGVQRMWLEVIRDNHRAVALYQSLGFTVRHGLCGYLSAAQADPRESTLEDYDLLSLLRHASLEQEGQLPWLLDPLTFITLPCRALTLQQQAFAVLATTASKPQLQFLWLTPAARGRGLGREMLLALAQQFPGLSTSVTIPETFTPLFKSAGYAPLALQQYEMCLPLN